MKWNDAQINYNKVKKTREIELKKPENTDPYKVSYRSAKLLFNHSGVKGTVFKRIENVKVYHSSQWHTKFFSINFRENALEVFETESTNKP